MFCTCSVNHITGPLTLSACAPRLCKSRNMDQSWFGTRRSRMQGKITTRAGNGLVLNAGYKVQSRYAHTLTQSTVHNSRERRMEAFLSYSMQIEQGKWKREKSSMEILKQVKLHKVARSTFVGRKKLSFLYGLVQPPKITFYDAFTFIYTKEIVWTYLSPFSSCQPTR